MDKAIIYSVDGSKLHEVTGGDLKLYPADPMIGFTSHQVSDKCLGIIALVPVSCMVILIKSEHP